MPPKPASKEQHGVEVMFELNEEAKIIRTAHRVIGAIMGEHLPVFIPTQFRPLELAIEETVKQHGPTVYRCTIRQVGQSHFLAYHARIKKTSSLQEAMAPPNGSQPTTDADTVGELRSLRADLQQLRAETRRSTSVGSADHHHRLLVVCDMQNLSATAHIRFGKRIQMTLFVRSLQQAFPEMQIVKTVVFVAERPETRKFVYYLARQGFKVVPCPPRNKTPSAREPAWDYNIDPHLIRETPLIADRFRANAVLIVSGDGDFLALMQSLQTKGMLTGVASIGPRLSNSIRNQADFVYFIEDHIAEFSQDLPSSSQQPSLEDSSGGRGA